MQVRQAKDCCSLSVPWFTAGLLSVLALRFHRPLAELLKGLHDRQGVAVSEQCSAPDCENAAPHGNLCAACEAVWMRERRDVVEEAEHWTDLAVRFQRYCAERGQPNPYDD